MIFNITSGGSAGGGAGAGLNFKVVGGTTAPSNPSENTIWVNTSTTISSWSFSSENPNLLDFSKWASNATVYNGTKSVSGGSITLTATGADCYTQFGSTTNNNVTCVPGKTYVMEWDYSGAAGNVMLFPSAGTTNMVSVANSAKKLEFTPASGVTFFTFRFGVTTSGQSTTYTNIRITEKERTFDEGAVWISTGNFSPVEFNALKKNSLQVYPVSAKQYVGGIWVSKDVKSYQSGKWVSWVPAGALYYYGNECVAESGGWNARGWSYSSSVSDGVTPVITNLDDHMKIEVLGNAYFTAGAVEVKTDQNLTNVNSITIDFEMTIASYFVDLIVINRYQTYMEDRVAIKRLGDNHTGTFTRRTATLDVSKLSGLYDIAICFTDNWRDDGGSVDMNVYSIMKE